MVVLCTALYAQLNTALYFEHGIMWSCKYQLQLYGLHGLPLIDLKITTANEKKLPTLLKYSMNLFV